MSEYRQDPLTGRWVILASGRGARPDEFGLRPRLADDPGLRSSCPFCPGHEDRTTPEILAVGRPAGSAANGPGWRMRAFPNMYPAVRPEAPAAVVDGRPGWARASAGVGGHEVVVYSTEHAAAPADLGPPEWAELLGVLRERLRAIAGIDGIRYVSPFCNHGPEAGATLTHPHMQIIGTREVPDQAVDRAVAWDRHRTHHGECLLCRLLDDERVGRSRLVAANAAGAVTTAYASRFPFEMLLMPAAHAPSLDRADRDRDGALGELLATALGALRRLRGDCSLNLVFHGAPLGGRDACAHDPRLARLAHDPDAVFHWHVEILPRLSRTAGFEVGTGFSINSILPEEAARMLRGEGEGR